MKYSTAKKYIQGYKASAAVRGIPISRSRLKQDLQRFQAALEHNGLIGKY